MTETPLRVYFLTTMNGGIAFYRQWQYHLQFLKQKALGIDSIMPWFVYDNHHLQGWQFDVPNPYVSGNKGFLNYRCSQADVVVVQYVHTMEALALIEALKACYPKTVFLTEIDDYILDTPTYNDAFEMFQPGWRFREVIVEQMKALDGIVVSTPYLAEKYREFNEHVYVVPNALDFSLWDASAKMRKPHKEIRIGWMGGASHIEDLRTIEKPIKELLKRRDNVWFYCVHGAPYFFRNQSRMVCPKKWSFMNRYHKDISKQSFDIGIAPLLDNGFNRAKSNLRKLEYAGLGIPVVAANVGEFARTVHHGKDGFLYDDADGFVKALEILISDKKLREAMGQYNRLDVMKNFNVEMVARDYAQILREAHKRGQTTTVDISPRARPGANRWTEGQPEVMSLSK